MKVTLAQINTTPNDFSGNFTKIQEGIEKAIADNSDIVVFPELTICGYLVRDLMYTSDFIERNLRYLQNIANLTFQTNLTVIVGYIDRNYTGIGKPFRNMAAVIKSGVVIANHQKRLLPGYNIFEEYLYFEPGKDNCVFDVAGNKCALLTCEEIWRDDKGETGNLRYTDNPIRDLKEMNINYLFSINSSPYAKSKPKYRIDMLTKIVAEWGSPLNLIYVNQIGGNDELIFDGHSMCISKGRVFKYIQTDILPKSNINKYETVDIPREGVPQPYINFEFENDHLRMTLLGLHDYVTKSGFKSIVLGSSGGVDSALVATLATLALGKDNVNCIMMPSVYSSNESVDDAKELHRNLGCNEYLIPINHIEFTNTIKNSIIKSDEKYSESADENIQARMRGQIIMYYSNAKGSLALTTGNKTEISVGYTTLYGDSCGGFNPIGDLYKCEVFDICRQINKLFGNLIPSNILNKAPSAELKPNQTDESSLLPYPILDHLVKLHIEKYITSYQDYCLSTDIIIRASEFDFNRITRLIFNNEFKRRQAAPIVKLSSIAFGTGRRIPICKKSIV